MFKQKVLPTVFFFTLFQITFLSLCFAAQPPSDWPKEAKDYFLKIPGDKLNVEFVVQRALESSDVFDIHRADWAAAEAPLLQVRAGEDSQFYLSHNREKSALDTLTPFEPIERKGWQNVLGFNKGFSSGTRLNFEGLLGRRNVLLQPGIAGSPVDSREGQVRISLEQDLWSNFFGERYRQLRRTMKLIGDSARERSLSNMESSVVDLVGLYYATWLNQKRAKNLSEGVSRKRKLLTIIRKNKRRGTAVASDVLRVETALVENKAMLAQTKYELKELWYQLIYNLKLPKSFVVVDPESIPAELDSPMFKANQLCTSLNFNDLKERSSDLRSLAKALKSAKESLAAAKKDLRPQLKFQAAYTSNAIEGESSDAINDVFDQRNTGWTAGLQLVVPLQNRGKKAELLNKHVDYARAVANESLVSGNLESQWRSLCESLSNKKELKGLYEQVYVKAQQRRKLDERRFRVGRLSSSEWIQSEEEEAQSQFRYHQAEVELRQVAWSLLKIGGELKKSLEKYLEIKE